MLIATNDQLIEMIIKAIKSNANTKTVEIDMINFMNHSNSSYNCWGFVAKIFNWVDKPQWIYEKEIEDYLNQYTKKIKIPKTGSIAVFRDSYGTILHTALIIKPKDLQIVHKPGNGALEYGSVIKDSELCRGYGNNITYRELKS